MTLAEHRSRHRFPTDSVGDYLHEISRVPLLTGTDEIELAQRIEVGLLAAERLARLPQGSAGDRAAELGEQRHWLAADGVRAMNHLICANLRLVVSVARHFTGRGLDLLDLIQEGNLGLIRAVWGFDHTRGFTFSTYATWPSCPTAKRTCCACGSASAATPRSPGERSERTSGCPATGCGRSS